MIAVRLFARGEIVTKLGPYKCRHLADLGDGLEIWETGWNYPFTLQSEGGRYDEWQYRRILASVIATTMPPDWMSENGNGPH
jgi:hypothetical protein